MYVDVNYMGAKPQLDPQSIWSLCHRHPRALGGAVHWPRRAQAAPARAPANHRADGRGCELCCALGRVGEV